LGDSLWDSLRDSLRASLGASLGASLRASLGASFYGQHEWWVAHYLFAALELGVQYEPRRRRQLDLWATIARSAGWWWPYEGVCVVSERPVRVAMEPDGRARPERDLVGAQTLRLHSSDGPAAGFRDGWGVHAWHGVRVPAKVIEQPEALTASEVLQQPNAEVRRVMVERLGADRLMAMAKPDVMDRDADQLGHPRRLLRIRFADDEPLMMVEVANSTPEPDGTLRPYLLRVPPQMTTCRQAVAWTFDMPAGAYSPAQET
jgi:hypothetical protein